MSLPNQPSRAPMPYLLIADDEPAVLEVLRTMARSLGWQPLLANTGTQALALFREHANDIDCVLVDLHMPQISGIDLLREMRALRADARVLVMTGDDIESDPFAGTGLEPDGMLSKPFFMTDLNQALFPPQAEAA